MRNSSVEKPAVRPRGSTIFCDDIREEVGGKHTYVGVYTDVMKIEAPSLPVLIPTLGTVVRVIIPSRFEFDNIVFRVKMERADQDGNVSVANLVEAHMDGPGQEMLDGVEDGKQLVFRFHARMSPLVIDSARCRILSRAYFGDLEVKLGVLSVEFTESAGNRQPTPGKQGA